MAIEQSEIQEEYAEVSGISFEEYLVKYNSVEGVKTEWTPSGVESYTMSNNLTHQSILKFLLGLLDFYLTQYQLGQVLPAGFPMYFDKKQPAREPDLLVVLNEHTGRIQRTRLVGAADIAVEIVSPESDDRDHGRKFVEYEAARIPEYWLIDPLRRIADIHILDDEGRYQRNPLDTQGRLQSTVLPGFRFDPLLLWQAKLPGGPALVALIDQMQESR